MPTNLHWRQAQRLADRLPHFLTWSAKRQAISDLLAMLHQALVSGRLR